MVRLAVTDREIEKLIGGNQTAGELGFLDQCRLAYSLGIIGKVALGDLKNIARIRNRFAHTYKDLTFAGDDKIRELCLGMKSTEEMWRHMGVGGASNDPKYLYMNSIHALHFVIKTQVEENRADWAVFSEKRKGIFW